MEISLCKRMENIRKPKHSYICREVLLEGRVVDPAKVKNMPFKALMLNCKFISCIRNCFWIY